MHRTDSEQIKTDFYYDLLTLLFTDNTADTKRNQLNCKAGLRMRLENVFSDKIQTIKEMGSSGDYLSVCLFGLSLGHFQYRLNQGRQTFSLKGQIITILGICVLRILHWYLYITKEKTNFHYF